LCPPARPARRAATRLWVVFLPLRMVMKRKDPEAYAASQRK
jgi:hypothetical protein